MGPKQSRSFTRIILDRISVGIKGRPMTLGGYIFKGYKFELPSDYDSTVDAQVIAQCLRLHKMKLKAFTESCAASGADWQFYETNGDASFESYGNVIYKLDTNGLNYASFFRYGSENAYYCMITMSDGGYYTGNSVQIYNYYWGYISSTSYRFEISNNLDSIGIEPITFSNMFDTSSGSMYHRLSFATNYGSVISGTTSNITKSLRNQHFGYVTKGKNIISIMSYDTTGTICYKVSSFDSLELASNTDNSNMFSFVQMSGTANAATGNYGSCHLACNIYTQISGNAGLPYEYDAHTTGSANSPVIHLRNPLRAVCILPNSDIPFEPVVFTSLCLRTNDKIMNSDGIPVKGSTSIDLLATNVVLSANYDTGMSSVIMNKSFANGNYLCIHKTRATSDSYWDRAGILYIGWDSTNPDIRIPDAWPVYNG